VDFPFFMSIDNATVHPHGRSRLMKPRDLPPQILQQMRDEVLQLMVWCIGTKKFSAEQIAEASDMISTHARWAAPQQRRTAGQPPSTVLSVPRARPLHHSA
jgi:hypothetical protein